MSHKKTGEINCKYLEVPVEKMSFCDIKYARVTINDYWGVNDGFRIDV